MKKLSKEKFLSLKEKNPKRARELMQIIVDGFRLIILDKNVQGIDISENEAMDIYLQKDDILDEIKDLLIEVNYGAKIQQDSDKMKALENANKQNIRVLEVESRSEYNKSMTQALFDEMIRRADNGEI